MTQNAVAETTHKAELELGPPVVDGRLIWSSASKITTADPNSSGGCLRKWWYENLGGRRQPSTEAQKRGTKLHDEIESHHTKGTPLLSQLAIAGRHYIDVPGPGVLIEAPLARRVGDNIEAWLTGNGIPIGGHVDLWNHRGSHIDREGDLRADPPKTLETKDWKTSSDFKWAKSPAELAENVQLITYAEAGFRMWPHLDFSRLTHVVFRTKGRPEAKLTTTIVDREHVARRWEYAEQIMRTIADAARELNVDKVDANKKSCSAFRGCPHRAICTAAIPSDYDSLEDILGPRGAAGALARLHNNDVISFEPGDLPAMSLINKLDPAVVAAGVAATPPPQPSLAPTMPAGAGVGVELRVDAEVARLEAEERARRAAQVAPPVPPPGFVEAYNTIAHSGRGMPSFAGPAAVLVTHLLSLAPLQYNGKPWVGGSGWLLTAVKQPVEDPTHLIPLAGEVKSLPPMTVTPPAPPAPPAPLPALAVVAPPVAAPVIAVLPPDAPASNPALAANPVEGLDNAKTRELAALTVPVIPGLVESVIAPIGTPPPMNQTIPATAMPSLIGAPPVSEPAPQMIAPVAPIATTIAQIATAPIAAEPAKKGPGRPRGSRKAKTTTVTEKAGDVERTTSSTVETDDSIDLFLDCMPAGDFDRLEPYIDKLCEALCTQYSAADIQCAPKDSPIGYNNWEGAVRALARRNPPLPGRYVVKTRSNRVAAIVAEALRAKVEETGGEFVEAFTP